MIHQVRKRHHRTDNHLTLFPEETPPYFYCCLHGNLISCLFVPFIAFASQLNSHPFSAFPSPLLAHCIPAFTFVFFYVIYFRHLPPPSLDPFFSSFHHLQEQETPFGAKTYTDTFSCKVKYLAKSQQRRYKQQQQQQHSYLVSVYIYAMKCCCSRRELCVSPCMCFLSGQLLTRPRFIHQVA